MPRAEGRHSLDLTGRLTTGAAAAITLHFPNLEMSADEKRQGAARAQSRRTEPGRLAPIPARAEFSR